MAKKQTSQEGAPDPDDAQASDVIAQPPHQTMRHDHGGSYVVGGDQVEMVSRTEDHPDGNRARLESAVEPSPQSSPASGRGGEREEQSLTTTGGE